MKFLRDAWYVAAWSNDVSQAEPTRIQIMSEWIVLFRSEAGQVHALQDRCPHRFAPLSKGRVVGEALRCPYHGLEFNGHGQCIHNPHGDGAIPNAAFVKYYPVTERFGAVWIWPGDISAADVDLLPDLSVFEQQEYVITHGYLPVQSSYDLVTDNLLDLSHAAFLHPGLASADSIGRTTTQAKQDGETVWQYLSVRDEPVSPLFRQVWDGEPGNCFVHINMRWNAPANMLQDTGAIPAGYEGEDYPRLPAAHLLTPETEETTHYFWIFGRNRRQQDEQVGQSIREMISYAFLMEDEPMIRDVQRNMEGADFWSLRPVILPGDTAAVRARRILEQKIRGEDRSRSAGQAVPASV